MANTTVEELLERASHLSAEERRRLVRWLTEERPEDAEEIQSRAQPSFLDEDPWFIELREAQKRAEEALGLHTLPEIMSHLRKRLWRTEG